MDGRERRQPWLSKERIYLYGPTAALVIAALAVAFFFIEPAPPSRIVIATGRPDGAYYQFGLKYRERLATEGITLDVRATSGAAENVRLLDDPSSGIDVAFVQGGVRGAVSSDRLVSLASVYFEPLWVFTRAAGGDTDIRSLAGKRLAVGPDGSGTRVLAELLLNANGIDTTSAARLPLTGLEAVEALQRGAVDAVFLVASPRAQTLESIVRLPRVTLMSFARADAYQRLYPYLSKLTLPEGTLSLTDDIPPRETALLAAAASLVVRPDFHPALSDLLLATATRVHGGPGIFERRGQFPSPDYVDFPLSEDARRYFQNGPPFLSRYLPFWMATLIDRMKVLLLPLIALMIPLFKIVPPTYRWRVKSKIYRWYRDIQAVDQALTTRPAPVELEKLAAELNRVEEEVRRIDVPLSYSEAVYDLRLHIDYVRREVEAARKDSA